MTASAGWTRSLGARRNPCVSRDRGRANGCRVYCNAHSDFPATDPDAHGCDRHPAQPPAARRSRHEHHRRLFRALLPRHRHRPWHGQHLRLRPRPGDRHQRAERGSARHQTRQVLAIGAEAKRMVGRTPATSSPSGRSGRRHQRLRRHRAACSILHPARCTIGGHGSRARASRRVSRSGVTGSRSAPCARRP